MGTRIAVTALIVLAAAVGLRVGAPGDPGADGPPPSAGRALVERVVDGDTVVLAGLGSSRLIGVDTPEVHGGRECFGEDASAFAKAQLSGRRVRYELGRDPRDRYDRALVYVWQQDGRLFNERLVAEGYARPLAIEPNVEYAALFERRAREARTRGRGLWEACR